jgi:hypothetical protein
MLFWTPSGLVFVPALVFGILSFIKIVRQPRVLGIVLTLALLNAPWLVVFLSVSKVGSFVKSEQPSYEAMAEGTFSGDTQTSPAVHRARATEISGKEVLRVLRDHAIGTNPLILFLALPGFFLLAGTRRNLYLCTSVWLLALGGVVSLIKPQVELDRMLVILGVLCTVPAGAALVQIFEQARKSPWARAAGALCLGFLLVTPLVASGVVKNQSIEQYYFETPLVKHLTEALKQNGGAGRVLFSGFVLHDLSNGHLAPLAFLSGKSLIASSPFHNQWHYRHVFPASFSERIASGGVEEYLDLYNVSAVFSHERKWRLYFLSKPEEYEQVWQEENFVLFKRVHFPNSYYLRGSGEPPQETSRGIHVRPTTSEVVLRYNYLPFLESSACAISGEQVAPEVTFIKLSNCPPGGEVVVRATDAWGRVK